MTQPKYCARCSACQPRFIRAVVAAESTLVVGEEDVRFVRGSRSYRVRGLVRNLSAESLKVRCMA